jgi:hypothetical protein
MFLVGSISFGLTRSVVLPLVIPLMALNAIVTFPVLRRYKHLRSWHERFKAAHAEKMQISDTLERVADKLVGPRIIVVIGSAYLLSVLAYFAGSFSASDQREFFVLDSYPGHALLRTYGDMLIASKVEEQSRQTGLDFLILRTSEIDALRLSAKKLGPLKRPPNF